MTRALADSYRAEMVRAARKGAGFDPATGEPAAWAAPEPVTWYQHAVSCAQRKWPHLAPHSRASLADALATVTPLLTGETRQRPSSSTLRSALYGYALTPSGTRGHRSLTSPARWLGRRGLRCRSASSATLGSSGLRWTGYARAWTALPPRRTPSPASGAVFHGALSHAVELGLLPANPISRVQWHAPRAAVAVNPATVASPAQVQAILAEVSSTGWPHEARGLKHRPDGTIGVIPIPPLLVSILHRHLRDHGTTPDGRMFRGTRSGILSESVYGRTWHAARQAALGPELAATALACRPYDLRHAALSLWLNATGAPAEVASRAGNSARVLHDMYLHCIDS